jgi:hypothetical protein
VRAGDVLMFVEAVETVRDDAHPVLTDEALLTTVATAADKLA